MMKHEESKSNSVKGRLSRFLPGKSRHGSNGTAGPPTPAKSETMAGPPYQNPSWIPPVVAKQSLMKAPSMREKPLPPPPDDDAAPNVTIITRDSPYRASPHTPRGWRVVDEDEDFRDRATASPSGPPPSIPLPKTPQLQSGPATFQPSLPAVPVEDTVPRTSLPPPPSNTDMTTPSPTFPDPVDLYQSPPQPESITLPDTTEDGMLPSHSRPLPTVNTASSFVHPLADSPGTTTLATQSPVRNSPTRTVSRPKGPRSPSTPTSRQASGSELALPQQA